MPPSLDGSSRDARRSRSRKPRRVSNSSGSCSRNASWPLSVAISTKLTLAATAFSACTSSRLSEVGNSQSLVNEITQNRERVSAKACGSDPLMLGREIEIIHRACDVEIGIGVEPVDKSAALMAQIAFDLEIGVKPIGDGAAVLQIAAEFAVQRRLRQIGDVRRHARHGEAARPACGRGSDSARRTNPDRP